MVYSSQVNGWPIAILSSMIFGLAGCGATDHPQGNSTTVIKQSGGSGSSTTEVIKTPDGQKSITRDGNSTDITIQSSDASGSSRLSEEGAAQPQLDQSRFERANRVRQPQQ